jgi:hypothetical protein
LEGGTPIPNGHKLQPGDTIYVSLGEDFITKNKKSTAQPTTSTETSQVEDPNKGFGIKVVQERMAWWAGYHYAQLRFWIAQDPAGRTACRGAPVSDAAELGQLVATSHLSIPELREVIPLSPSVSICLHLPPTVSICLHMSNSSFLLLSPNFPHVFSNFFCWITTGRSCFA